MDQRAKEGVDLELKLLEEVHGVDPFHVVTPGGDKRGAGWPWCSVLPAPLPYYGQL